MGKETGKCRVLMAGPAASVRGGMRRVVDQYLSCDRWGQIELRYVPTYVEGPALKKLLFFACGFLRIGAVCVTRQADILHLHVSERGSFWRKALLLTVGRWMGVRTVLHHHGAEFFDFFEQSSASVRRIITGVIERADLNLVLSEYHCQIMRSKFPKGNFAVLYNAVDASDGTLYRPGSRGIAFVGRLGQRKGTYDLIRAMERIEDVLPPDIRFFFCGDGDVEAVSQLLRDRGLSHRVGHLGWCSREQLASILLEAMLFVLPSYHEGLPMSVLEAMSAGIPCIVSGVDAIPEVIRSGSNGLLIEPGAPGQIADAILRLVRDPDARRTLGENGQRTVRESFLLEMHVERLKQMYQKLKDE